jgi:anaerobic ribonucleoside-triphosphate reductase activating protein
MSFENGTSYIEWLPKIDHYLEDYKLLIERIFLVGGSPNHQDSEQMEIFLTGLKRRCRDIDVYMFCGENIDEVQDCFKKYCDYIKCGAYIPTLACDDNIQQGIKLATSNQKIYKKGVDY